MKGNAVARRVALKEIRLFFSSPVAWLFLAAFSGITLFSFFWLERFFARNIADVRPLFEIMPLVLVFLCAALTMRMWSDERRSGTLEYVLTLPAPTWQFVLGKFYACLFLLIMALASTLPLPVTVALMANLDWGPVIGGYVAATLLGAAYLSIGLFVSARTDNAIVSLIGTIIICGLLYFVGSDTLTAFVNDRSAEFMRLLGSGTRFDSITRGVLDLRDLFYYASLVIGFLALCALSLQRDRWAHRTRNARRRQWRAGVGLLLANLLLANAWLAHVSTLRVDLTHGKQFTISSATTEFLSQLEEPLLIRGYFSERTHPALAPLVPQLRDLIREYEVAGQGKVRVEFIDPALDPAAEDEANTLYNIAPAPFQVADRHQSAVVNAYFNILVSYGDQHETLGFGDFIEVRTAANQSPEVMLRNPEYDLTHAIKKVLFNYRTGGNLFDSLGEPVEFIGYVSSDVLLPQPLQEYRAAITQLLEQAASASGGKFSVRFVSPEARGGAVAKQILEEWDFKPMVAALGSDDEFYFYLTLADSRQVVQLPTDRFDPAEFRLLLDSGLKRFARGLTRTVALVLPDVDAQMAQYNLGAPTFRNLERVIAESYAIELEDLTDGQVAPHADLLAVVAPHALDEASIYAIDQFLMRGGTVVLATSPFTTELSGGKLELRDWPAGLEPWLGHMGIEIGKALVLDRQNAPFAAPVLRQAGDYEFRDVKMVDYPYFIDLRAPGLAAQHPVTTNLPQVTMAWASPIEFRPAPGQGLVQLLRSSRQAWTSNDPAITPTLDGAANLPPAAMAGHNSTQEGERQLLGISLDGRFDSFFAGEDIPAVVRDALEREGSRDAGVQRALPRSPESARIVLFASNDFMDDQVLANMVTASGTQYLGPLELFMNTLDWALQDDQLLSIRNRAHFNRTLPPMDRTAQQLIEYINYGLSLLWLGLLALVSWILRSWRRRSLRRSLQL